MTFPTWAIVYLQVQKWLGGVTEMREKGPLFVPVGTKVVRREKCFVPASTKSRPPPRVVVYLQVNKAWGATPPARRPYHRSVQNQQIAEGSKEVHVSGIGGGSRDQNWPRVAVS